MNLHHIKKSFFILATTSIFALTTHAQNIFPNMQELKEVNQQGKASFSLLIENDSLLLNKDDGFFTSGIHIGFNRTLQLNDVLTTYGIKFGQELYTASDINLKPAQLSSLDHPYAGWVYIGALKENKNQYGAGSLLGFELGCLGPCAGGEKIQKNLHRLLNQPLPQAWSSQLKQELGVLARIEWSPENVSFTKNMDLTQRYKTRLGNIFTDVSAELTWRYGSLPSIYSSSAHHVFAKAEVKAVAYNATIQGGYFNQQVLSVNPQRIVPEMELGYVYRQNLWGVNASFVRRGNEIKELSNAKGAQNFIRLQFLYSME